MIGDDHALTPGYVARHVPPGSRIGIDVAVLDIAQDFLLAHLAERGVGGRWHIAVESPFGNPAMSVKLDVGPPTWLEPESRPFVSHVTHDRYGFTLPAIPSVRLEEILAEKIARLTRSGTARDASDLVWAATTSPHSSP